MRKERRVTGLDGHSIVVTGRRRWRTRLCAAVGSVAFAIRHTAYAKVDAATNDYVELNRQLVSDTYGQSPTGPDTLSAVWIARSSSSAR
jgi:hypothetical protein